MDESLARELVARRRIRVEEGTSGRSVEDGLPFEAAPNSHLDGSWRPFADSYPGARPAGQYRLHEEARELMTRPSSR